MLEVSDIHTFYGSSHVLHGVSLRVAAGQVITVLGRNGMGKTTLIRSIVGFTPPRRGTVSFRGAPIHGLRPFAIARLGIGLVPQGRRIFPSLSVQENLRVAARPGRWDLDGVYALFPRLHERAANRGHQLSGGEQQMLAIARALMTNPDLLLLDEPSEGLAPLLVAEVARALGQLRAQGMAILLVEQNLPMAVGLADHAYVLSKGRVVYDGSPAALWADEARKAELLGV
ncbi:MAG: ABC transporter ATP-binding protein [Armatimonadota bacterium]|nr:ABC transporter ATP-binding protein [Armatimonadota bacterium]MDR7421032.1 ABC transporter ATP-binding protein [Armatimonadota bacterium]MDR7453625.1 ABC transporter ATP-binding protein [Armatimonadota bacterium]MDR7456823.1 ABC transporter ATP-binding protein [Armatimonadota bacterium]MDR7495490.1 ABC transporter ATP-binding protein [Armatimonadota bacterium]